MGINDYYYNYVTAATFILFSFPPELYQRGAALNVGRVVEGEAYYISS